ncbi:helix-turn-helix DNA binding domain protein [Arthrobacter phage TripleJ]|uniref:Helix-turn-helix DNA binding domain protein n=1 Tax=Arthrobacter phage TripleJ TaxID=2599838 RepID=A0A5J6TLH7_9CAUD|nr:helix-turn-helix DNA binding domain protein [Arthrobacter phage TripleJ]QFG09582.1 helix-turn-helix DNA binding domain protein [Arthrobacter phage TripleJ]
MNDQDKQILALAGEQFKYSAAREAKARELFGLSGVRFWQEVNRILDTPAAHAHDPHTVTRLKRQRVQRHRPRVTSRML